MQSAPYKALGWYPVLAVGATGAAFSVIKTGRDAVFFSNTGLDQLPWANLTSEIGLAVAAYIHLSAMKRFGTRRTRTSAFLLAGAMFLAFVPLIGARGLVVQILYPVVPVVFAALFSTAWLLAGDVLEGATDQKIVQRVYSFTGASAMIGGIMGGLLAKALAEVLAPSWLVGAGAILLIANAWLCASAHAKRKALIDSIPGAQPAAPATPEPAKLPPAKQASEDVMGLLKHPYTRMLLVISSLATLAAMYVEFQFYAAAFLSGKAGPQFFADYYVLLCVASLAFQLLVTPWIQSRYGVARALLVLPAGILGGAGMVAFTATVVTQSLFRVIETSLKNSIHRSSWEQVFLHFDRERRAEVKVMIDGTVPRAAGIAGSIALYFIVSNEHMMSTMAAVGTWLAWVLVPIAAIWIYMTRSLGRSRSPDTGTIVQLAPTEPEIRPPDS